MQTSADFSNRLATKDTENTVCAAIGFECSMATRMYLLAQCDTSKIFFDTEELHNYLSALYVGCCEETGIMLMFSGGGKLLGIEKIGNGLRDQGIVSVRKAVMTAREHGAKAVIIAHNHPDGIAVPSDADIAAAMVLDIRFGNAEMPIREHYIVANGRCHDFTKLIRKSL